MIKRIGLFSAVALSLMAGAVPAGAQDGTPAYIITFYSDSTHTTQVGVSVGSCGRNGTVRYTTTGTTSGYFVQTLRYYCGPYGPEPIE